jgi:hypothetical protein
MPNIRNDCFSNLFGHFEKLVTVDLSDCTGLKPNSLHLLLKKNLDLENIQLSGCSNAVDDLSLKWISNLLNLSFIDLSYCKKFTENGCRYFEKKTIPL